MLRRSGNLESVRGIARRRVGDRKDAYDRMVAFAQNNEHDRAGAILCSLFASFTGLRFPEIE
jgi:hypothetical protein